MKKTFFSLAAGAILVGGVAAAAPFALQAAPRVVGSVDNVTNYSTWGLAGPRTVIVGWAGDTSANDTPVTITVTSPTLGGQIVDQFKTSVSRTDVQQAYGGSVLKGFNWVVPARFYTGQTYDFNFYASIDGADYLKYPIGSKKVTTTDSGFRGSVDRLSGNTVTGWAIDLDGDDLATQQTAIMITIDGQQVVMGLTDQERFDVMTYWNQHGYGTVGNRHGFAFPINVPAQFRDGKVHTIIVFGLEFTEGSIQQIGSTMYKTITTDGVIQ